METVNLKEKFGLFAEYWSPKVVGELNNFAVKVVKVKGEFVWHHHDQEDELFLVVQGRLCIQVVEDGKQRDLWIEEGEFAIIPHGVEHRPVAEEEAHVLLLEPNTVLNTGNVQNERTVLNPERL
jgi:mannose-6-phosphate isomerase-like protein (cupin superfamily)